MKGSRHRRKVDILGMIVNIIGSKDQLVNEYRVMLAEKLLNKSDYDIDSEIRTLELLKVIHKINAPNIFFNLGGGGSIPHMLILNFFFVIFRFILEKVACRNVKLCSMI